MLNGGRATALRYDATPYLFDDARLSRTLAMQVCNTHTFQTHRDGIVLLVKHVFTRNFRRTMHCLSTPSISQDAAALFANQQSGNLEPTCRELPWQRTRSMKRLPFRRTALSNKNMMLIVALSGLVLFFYTFHSILTGVPPIYGIFHHCIGK